MRRARDASAIFGAALAVLTIGACGGTEGESDGTFDRASFPFTFAYPDDFTETTDVTLEQQLGTAADETIGIALDNDNAILVQRFTLQREVGEKDLPLAQREFDRILAAADPDIAPGRKGDVAGFPSLSYDAIGVPEPEGAESRVTFLFDGDQEYAINCQSAPDDREELEAACDMALGTLAER